MDLEIDTLPAPAPAAPATTAEKSTPSNVDADVDVEVPSKTQITPSPPSPTEAVVPDPTADIEESEVDSHLFRNIFFGLVFLGLLSGAFIYFGGLRWARQHILSGRGATYRKIAEDDVEK